MEKIPFSQYFIRMLLDAQVNPKPKATPKPPKIYPRIGAKQNKKYQRQWARLQEKNKLT